MQNITEKQARDRIANHLQEWIDRNGRSEAELARLIKRDDGEAVPADRLRVSRLLRAEVDCSVPELLDLARVMSCRPGVLLEPLKRKPKPKKAEEPKVA